MWLPRPVEEVFDFFRDITNLDAITPPHLRFETTTPNVEMKLGAVFEHRLRFRGLPMRWVSEITEWDPPHRFADSQRVGPYRYWRHEHEFVEHEGGTMMRDCICYAIPGGRFVDRLFVRPDLERIFDHREAQMKERLAA